MRRRSKAITEALQAKIANLPTGPGVYQFYDRHGGLLYVGKSLNLRRRVRSYFAPSQNWEKAQGMLPLITDLQALPCDTHLEARLLECEQIKTLRPPFNSQMKGDRRYIYLDLPADRLPQVISRRTDTSVGPFRSQWNLRRFLTSLRLLYPLEERADGLRLTYHPLPLRLSAASQSSTSALLRRCLTEEAMADALLTAAEQQMLVEAEEMRFERAAFFKDLLPTLRRLKHNAGAYRDFLAGTYHVALPLAKGTRHFYIRDGLVADSAFAGADETFNLDLFLFMAATQPRALPDEKAALDFRDIVFTELQNFPAEQVTRL